MKKLFIISFVLIMIFVITMFVGIAIGNKPLVDTSICLALLLYGISLPIRYKLEEEKKE